MQHYKITAKSLEGVFVSRGSPIVNIQSELPRFRKEKKNLTKTYLMFFDIASLTSWSVFNRFSPKEPAWLLRHNKQSLVANTENKNPTINRFFLIFADIKMKLIYTFDLKSTFFVFAYTVTKSVLFIYPQFRYKFYRPKLRWVARGYHYFSIVIFEL